MTRPISYCLLISLLAVMTYWSRQLLREERGTPILAKLDQIVRVSNEEALDCSKIATQQPIVILAIGQSNAANHGAQSRGTKLSALLFAEGKCIIATDPLPGSTGNGGSIWSHLPGYFEDIKRPIILSVMGIDATSIRDWTGLSSPLQQSLRSRIQSMKAVDLSPQIILWQQGEADAKLGTTKEDYRAELDNLEVTLKQAGAEAVIVAALSTVCRSPPNAAIREAVFTKAENSQRFEVGPDTDTLHRDDSRIDGCHFSEAGLEQAAKLWASELRHIFASI